MQDSRLRAGALAHWHEGGFDPGMLIRKAIVEDAEAAAQLLRRSITELCYADHGGDPEFLAEWLSNKTPESIASWIALPDNHFFVAVEADAVLAVGAISESGEITLNYVAPEARFRGLSKAMVRRLEAQALDLGHRRCTLMSTKTARNFYLALGYRDRVTSCAPGRCQPMEKILSSASDQET